MILAVLPIRYAHFVAHPNARALIEEYSAECSIEAIGRPEPQAEMYEQMEQAAMMQGFAAYADGELIGFANVLVSINPHHGVKLPVVESIFVGKEHRCTSAGFDLMDAIKAYAGSRGCGVVLYCAPVGGSFESLLSKRKDCQRTNSVFCQRIA